MLRRNPARRTNTASNAAAIIPTVAPTIPIQRLFFNDSMVSGFLKTESMRLPSPNAPHLMFVVQNPLRETIASASAGSTTAVNP